MTKELTIAEYFRRSCEKVPFPALFDDIAARFPNHLFASIPRNNARIEDGYRDITYAKFAKAVNKAARYMVQKLGKEGKARFETVHYVGPQDLRYMIFVLAASKAGRKVRTLLPSLLLGSTIALCKGETDGIGVRSC